MSDQDNQDGSEPKPRQTPPDSASAQGKTEIIPPALDSALRNVGIDPRDPAVSRAIEISLTMAMFSGSLPLPPPEILKEYDSVHAGLSDKLIEWTERQSEHRRLLETKRTDRTEDRYDRGQRIAAGVALGGLFLSSIVGIWGNPWVAGVMAIVAVGGPTAAIWLARNIRSPSSQLPKPPISPRSIAAGRPPNLP
jgi:uncharacterized membrane protein